MSLHELLAEMNVAAPVLDEVKTAEDSANTAIALSVSPPGLVLGGVGGARYIGKITAVRLTARRVLERADLAGACGRKWAVSI